MHKLRLFDLTCMGINGIVGSGIFLIPGLMIATGGPASVLMFPVCAFLLMSVALCFARASRYFPCDGGPYQYARAAFGNNIAFGAGWLTLASGICSHAAVAAGLPTYIAALWPTAGNPIVAKTISVLIIIFFALLNLRGIRIGALTINTLTIAKLVPLGILTVLSVAHFSPPQLHPFAPHGYLGMHTLLLAILFTFQGFEVVPVPAGATHEAERIVPRAVIASLAISALLYTILQLGLVGLPVDLTQSPQPLATAAEFLLGKVGLIAISVGALVSMLGFCAGAPIYIPRYLTAMSDDRLLPAKFAERTGAHHTPRIAILVTSAIALVGTIALNFSSLVDLTGFVTDLQYLIACVALPRLHRRYAPDVAWSLGERALPFIGTAVTIFFMTQISRMELAVSLGFLAVGVVLRGAWQWTQRNAAPPIVKVAE